MTFAKPVIPLICAFLIGFPPATANAAEPTEEMRQAAKVLAGQEDSIEKRNLKGYCAATYGSASYAAYVARACQLSVRNNLKKVEDCGEAHIRQEVAKDTDRCTAMSDSEFDTAVTLQRRARASFVRAAKEKDVDGEKLIQAERDNLRQR